MKLLFDENLSPKLVELVATVFPGSAHVHELGLGASDDADVWRFAAERDFVIVSKDADFHARSELLGFPPKFIWVRVGNSRTARVARLLLAHTAAIQAFVEDDTEAYMQLL